MNLLTIIQQLILILIGVYGLTATVHIVLHFWMGDLSTPVAFLATFAHLMWMPSLILLPIMLIAQQWWIVLLLLSPVVMFLKIYGRQFVPQQANIPPNSKRLTIQTHNLLASNRKPEQLGRLICDISADIVTLQEVSVSFVEMLSQLDGYPYQSIHAGVEDGTPLSRETMGQAVLSRYPILEDAYWVHDYLPKPLAHQRVVIDVDGQHVVIYNVHPTHPNMAGSFFDPRFRRREISELMSRITAETHPIIMIGDCNLSDLSLEYAQITAHLKDTFREVGRGMGFTYPDLRQVTMQESTQIAPDSLPSNLPIPSFLRLDYAFHSEEIRGVKAYIWRQTSGGSDHRPLVVELALDMP